MGVTLMQGGNKWLSRQARTQAPFHATDSDYETD